MTRSTRRRERGQALPALALIAAGLVAFTVFVTVPLGSASDRRAQVRTAADAAALAAVESVAANLRGTGTILPPGLGGSPGDGVALVQKLERLQDDGALAAADYASRNDAELTDFAMTVSLAGRRPVVEAYAETRSEDPIESTEQYARAEATARLDVLGGICGAGNAWGLELEDGTCRKVTDLLDPRPTPSPGDEGDDNGRKRVRLSAAYLVQ